jgi:tight adherence protein C
LEQLIAGQSIVGILSPGTFGLLVGLAVLLTWNALSPARRPRDVDLRLEGYVDRDVIQDQEMARPLMGRAVVPVFRRTLRILGGLMPHRYLERTAQLLVRAGNPGGLTALDFLGIRLLTAILLAGGAFLFFTERGTFAIALRNTLIIFAIGILLPQLWLKRKARKRQNEIRRALPDALDMLTVGVEAGLAFESALLRVGQQWENALTEEFRQLVSELRMGVSRSEAFVRMAERVDVEDVSTFVAVFVQSSQLGVSIAQVLHTQADQMRIKRRQRAEELARQASVKMIVVLVFFIFPAMFIVTVGPVIPGLVEFFQNMSGG